MTTDPVRVRILGIRAYPVEIAHEPRACHCVRWATQWRDSLIDALPASARGRIDIDVQMAHPMPMGPSGRPVPRTVQEPAFSSSDGREARNGDQDAPVVKVTANDHDPARVGAGMVSSLASAAEGSTAQSPAPAPAEHDPTDRRGGSVTRFLVGDPLARDEPERQVAALAELLLGDDRAKAAMREHVVAMIDEFEPDVVLGYRTGSVLAYEALARARRPVPLFVSVGSPIAMPQLFSALNPEPAYAQGRWPDGAEHWIDVYDQQDPFATRRPLVQHFDGPVADRPVALVRDGRQEEEAYLSCQVMGIMLEDYFGRRRVAVNLSAELRRVLSLIFPSQGAIFSLLSDIGFPASRLPVEFPGADETWRTVIEELSYGTLDRGVESLVEQARQRYPENRELRRLSRHCNRPAARY